MKFCLCSFCLSESRGWASIGQCGTLRPALLLDVMFVRMKQGHVRAVPTLHQLSVWSYDASTCEAAWSFVPIGHQLGCLLGAGAQLAWHGRVHCLACCLGCCLGDVFGLLFG
jgi:hypothetical protein